MAETIDDSRLSICEPSADGAAQGDAPRGRLTRDTHPDIQ
jgi:hypothetical protein